MSEQTTEATKAPPTEPQTDPKGGQGDPDKPLGENGEKALKVERERANAAEKVVTNLQKQLDEIAAANLSDLEKAQKQAADAQETAAEATAEALRYRVAAKHSISDEDAALFLTGTDEETLTKQAQRLTDRAQASPRPDPSQGARGGDPKSSTADQFAAAVEGQFTT